MERIGARLRRLRVARGLTQQALADLAEVQQTLISRIETGKTVGEQMQLGTAMRLAWALGISVDALSGLGEGV